jgi:Putative phage tail protein
MATLVLTAVGTALGGPIGGALGAILGQQVDAALFAPKARAGARLTDLKVQTSSYGDAIPKLFGTLRVAGTVIWATDLIERRQKRSQGKGRPKLVEFSYSASLAVAVSARAIRSVGRIWADGNLLRDATGKLAETVTVRVHDGGADQAADPLIASALGPDQGCAFRGLAYVMLEELDLTAFGNRIPQLSFEIVADDAPVSVAAVASELTGSVVGTAAIAALIGYAASGARVREAIAPLAELAQLGLRQGVAGWQIAAPETVVGAPVDGVLARVHATAALRADSEQRAPLRRVAAAVSLRHYDPARDYQTSVQTAAVAGGGAAATVLELPGALAAGAARGEAQRLALVAGDMRRTLGVRAGLGALALPLGAVCSLAAAGFEGRWRIAERIVDNGGVRLTLVQHAPPVVAAGMAGDGGAAQVPGDLPGGTTMLAIFDVPGDGETARNSPLRLIAAAGSDARWRGADLWWVAEAGAEPEAIGRIGGALAFGVLAVPVAAMTGVLVDRASGIEVILANEAMTLANISHAQLLGGGNRAMLGGEAVQFERATPLGAGRWRLEGLLRGRGGTEDVAGPHAVGTPFVLIDDAALLVLPDAMAAQAVLAGAVVERQERGSADMMPHPVPAGARATLPLVPVHGRVSWIAGGGRRAEWTARSRVGARWRDGVDVPPGERRLRWRVRYADAANVPVEIEVEVPWVELMAGSFFPATALSVVQVGDYGLSPPLVMLLA